MDCFRNLIFFSFLFSMMPGFFAWAAPEDVPEPPDIFKHGCVYLGEGLSGSGTPIATRKHEKIVIFGVDLTYQCRLAGNDISPETQKAYIDALGNYARKLAYMNISAAEENCGLIAFNGGATFLSSKPDDEKPYLYRSNDLLVQYHGSFQCRVPGKKAGKALHG